MPPRVPVYTPYLTSLIQSTSYPSIPTADELQSLQSILSAQSNSINVDLEKRIRKEKKRKERQDGETAALEANERVGMKLEAIERARTEAQAARKGSPAGGGMKVKKERTSISPAPSNASSASFRPKEGPGPIQPLTYGQSQQLKKKKKRVVDSDDEAKTRDRSTTLASPPPHIPHGQSISGLKLKVSGQNAKSRPHVDPSPTPSASTAAVSAIAGSSIDFSLPAQSSRPLIPPRPGVQQPLKPGPKRQSEVDEDFSNTKAPNQVLFTTFWSSVEPYLREIREDDLAMLGFKADAPELYELPSKGRHYTEVWDEEDGLPPGTTSRVNVPNMRRSSSGGSKNSARFVPAAEIREEVLVDEMKGLGNLTERIVAAVVGDMDTSEAKKAEVAGKPRDDAHKEAIKVDVVDLEEKVKRELRSVMLLGEHEEFDPQNRDDDEITSALRQCQRLLLQQTTVNDARKARLAEAARQRLAHVDYTSALEGIEKSIEAGWAKRVKKHGIMPKKITGPGQPLPFRPPVQDNLKRLVAVRKRWIETVGKILKERLKGQIPGFPTQSIYEGIGEEMEEKDEKAVEETMAIESAEDEEMEGVAGRVNGHGWLLYGDCRQL